mgnify:CR=1 FL=1|tara:strand:- start:3271 stop:3447 length:177 start_codon:yes stop_codon:yes gene_type:complete
MKMDIVESDLKQLFMWIKNLQELCESQTALIESHHDVIESLEQRLNNIELLLTQEDNK